MTENSRELLDKLRIDRTPSETPRKTALWVGLGVAVLLVAAAYAAWTHIKTPVAQFHTAVATKIGANASVLDATGYVTARRMATVSSKITGKVKEVMIEEGQHIKAGEVMATLDPIDADAQRALADSQLSVAKSEIGSLRAQLKLAEANVVRYQELVARKFVAPAQLDQYISQRDSLLSQLDTAQRNIQVATDQVRVATDGVDNTVIRAPFSGVIIAKAAQPGEIVSPLSAGGGFTRTGIGTLVDMDSLEIEVDVNEAYIGRVLSKMPVDAILNAYPDWKIPAEVIAIIPSADRSKATVKVRIALLVKDPRIVPEMGVKVSFRDAAQSTGADINEGVRVPATAIGERDGKPVAFVVGPEQKIERRALKVGRSMGEDRQVLAGLNAGETVVVSPSPNLADGVQIHIAPAEGSAP
ncbi:Acriflavin resistance protein [Collimonas arenae]|uniref:Acriflavin resistance protein n=1 Tax=Collimonas arenae TaxID=279058 RepID=A0A0A1FA95_9BURK|nr:efflux RND transporter periplasmic adaptor subunit [Collimonas arenae]AIY41663.1 Acriflavin resistance protein [Collimonas arenae]